MHKGPVKLLYLYLFPSSTPIRELNKWKPNSEANKSLKFTMLDYKTVSFNSSSDLFHVLMKSLLANAKKFSCKLLAISRLSLEMLVLKTSVHKESAAEPIKEAEEPKTFTNTS